MYDKDGEQKPGKGIALKPENYSKIKVRSPNPTLHIPVLGVSERNRRHVVALKLYKTAKNCPNTAAKDSLP